MVSKSINAFWCPYEWFVSRRISNLKRPTHTGLMNKRYLVIRIAKNMLVSNMKTICNHLYVSTVIFVPVGTVYVRSIRQCHMSQIELTILKLTMAKIA